MIKLITGVIIASACLTLAVYCCVKEMGWAFLILTIILAMAIMGFASVSTVLILEGGMDLGWW